MIDALFDTSSFPPRWHCGEWSRAHGWTHIVSDLLIFGAYASIPVVLCVFVLRRRDIPFPKIFWLFALFILCCGVGHLIEATIFWQPWYRLSALVKAATAIVSWATVIALTRITPVVLRLPGLAAVNRELEVSLAALREKQCIIERSNQELESFAHAVSHDLKAPLRAVSHLTNWVVEDSEGCLSSESLRHLCTLQDRVARMDRLLDDLLLYAQVGKHPGKLETVDVAELVNEVVELLAPPPGVRVEVADLPLIITERTPLKIVFQNLIGNAIKHNDRPECRIEISCSHRTDVVEFTVADDGPGIGTDDCVAIFEPFRTLRPKDEIEGSGLGLALVKKAVEAHGGLVWIDAPGNEGGERGTRFVFTWAKVTEGEDAAESVAEPAEQVAG